MKLIKFTKVICVNNEIQGHGSKNLLLPEIDERKSWLCEKGTQRGVVILQLECPTIITAVRIGNAHSAFVEVLVGNLGEPTDKYQTLIPPSLFMNCYDSKSGTNSGQVKFFYQKDFIPATCGKEWNVVQIVCTQPFNDKVPFGICFVRVSGLGDDLDIRGQETEPELIPKVFLKEEGTTKEERKLTMAEEMQKAAKSPKKMKAASINPKTSAKRKRDENEDADYPDNRKNKNLGLEESPQNSPLEKKRASPELSWRDGGEGSTQRSKKKEKAGPSGRPLSRLMDDVNFVISGFKNPERGNIRSLALKMGARCSFMNTPKYKEVKGKGKIVKKDWIEACYNDRKRYPWRRFALDPDDAKIPESEEEEMAKDRDTSEDEDKEAGPSSGRRKPRKRLGSGDAEVTETDDEPSAKQDTTNYPMPYLPNILSGKTFYIERNMKECPLVERYVVAYGGKVTDALDEGVEFYVTTTGGAVLRIMRKKAPKMRAVKPDWIWEMNAKAEWISPWKFMISG